jgi:hypothetical protein
MNLGLFGKPPLEPIFPSNTGVSMRGGAGESTVTVYGLNGFGLKLKDDRENSATPFLEASLQILGMPKTTTTYEFVVDQYRNQEAHKNVREKEHVKSFPVSQSNFAHVYDQYLKSRLFNRQRDWPMVVRRASDNMSTTFGIPSQLKTPLTPATTMLPSKSPVKPPTKSGAKPGSKGITKTSNSPNKTLPNPGPNERVVYSLDGKKWQLFKNDFQSFFEAACRIVDQTYSQGISFGVSQYSMEPVRQAPSGQAGYVNTIRWPNGGSGNFYSKYVEACMFNKGNPDLSKERIIVAHPVLATLPRFWPEGSSSARVNVAEYLPPSGQQGTSQGQEGTSQAQKTSPSKKNPTAAANTKQGYIHGYAGIIHAENTAASFQKAGLRLLGLDPATPWSYYICIGRSARSYSSQTIKVQSRNFSETFLRQIRPLIPRTGDWQIFVSARNLNSLPKPMEPSGEERNVVRICHENNTTYWKIPKNTKTDYGINQLQDDFFRAMSVLFPMTDPRPPWNVHIGPAPFFVDIGFGGMEVTHQLWNRVVGDLEDLTYGGLAYTVKLVNQGQVSGLENSSQLIGIRMPGQPQYASAQPSDYAKIQGEITKLAFLLKGRIHPAQFKLWKTARDRETNAESMVIPYDPPQESMRLIKFFLKDNPETNCLWFRPEWPLIQIKDVTNGDGIGSNTEDWQADVEKGYDHFKSALGRALKEPNLNNVKDIEIMDSESQLRFIFSNDTPEPQWRKHIYDWFPGEQITVRRSQNIVYGK